MAESAASAPPPRQGPPLIPPPRSSALAAGGVRGTPSPAPGADPEAAGSYAGDGEDAIDAFNGDGGSSFEEGPALADLEAQMGDEVSNRDSGAAAPAASRRVGRARAAAEDEDEGEAGAGGKAAPLPELDELVARISPEVRETLEELFRARFVAVKKLSKRVFSKDE